MERVGFIKYADNAPAKTCDQCGGVFRSHIHNAKRCSKKCKDKYRASWEKNVRKNTKKNSRTVSCPICSTETKLPAGSQITNLCCSDGCRKVSNQRRAQKQILNGNQKKWQKDYNKTHKSKERHKRHYKSQTYEKTSLLRNKKPENRLKHVLWATIKRCCKKNHTTSFYIDYSPDELKNHIENQFTEGMTWENYGRYGWHIDHIKPLYNFQFYDKHGNVNIREIRNAMALQNLQPLWASDNIRKGNNF